LVKAAESMWKERFHERMPQLTSHAHNCTGVGTLWSQSVARYGTNICSAEECFPCALDDMVKELPNDRGRVFARQQSARSAVLWNVICTVPETSKKLEWADGILEGRSSRILRTMNIPIWATLTRDSDNVIWVEYKHRKRCL
jgi:hypothetical protein